MTEAEAITPEAANKIKLLGGDKDIPNPFRGNLKKYQNVFARIKAEIDRYVNSDCP